MPRLFPKTRLSPLLLNIVTIFLFIRLSGSPGHELTRLGRRSNTLLKGFHQIAGSVAISFHPERLVPETADKKSSLIINGSGCLFVFSESLKLSVPFVYMCVAVYQCSKLNAKTH